jgi:phospholipid/cholesterol/gamma-HCH transport system substrate-binding protein
MNARRVVGAALLLAAIAVFAVVRSNGGDAYRVRLVLDNADGLRQGGEVALGGVAIGKIDSLHLGRRDAVIANLELDDGQGPIGRGATAAIAARNLLGQKFVDLYPGDVTHPLPSGSTLRGSRVQTPTDLDQVLDVLDTDTRTRLGILINETGVAVAGRKADFNGLLRDLPRSLADLRQLFDGLDSTSRTLSSLVRRSDAVVGRLATQRRALGRLVAAAGGAGQTVSARRGALRETLARTPATLTALRQALVELRTTAATLRPAAREITATAAPLADTLRAVEQLPAAAKPALRQARAIAPRLNALGKELTPVLRRAVPTAQALGVLSGDAGPLMRALDVSVDDSLGVVEGWARAIQGRDGLGHSFRIHLGITADTIGHLVNRLQPTPAKRERHPSTAGTRATPPATAPGSAKLPATRVPQLPSVIGDLPRIVENVTGRLKQPSAPAPAPADAPDELLDFLLGP